MCHRVNLATANLMPILWAVLLLAVLLAMAAACAGPMRSKAAQPIPPAPIPPAQPIQSVGDRAPDIQLVESWPVDTTLDHPDIPDAHQVWLEMIDSAERSLDIEQFYASTAPDSRLEDVLAAIERAAARGVAVRCVFSKVFYEGSYPEVPDRLAALPGVRVRIIDLQALSDGVQHAKFFVVDGRDAYLGSQNLDWRSLTHIQELGVRARHPEIVAVVAALFEFDWNLAQGGPNALDNARAAAGASALAERFPIRASYRAGTDDDSDDQKHDDQKHDDQKHDDQKHDDQISVTPGISPKGLLPGRGDSGDSGDAPKPKTETETDLWDLPRLLALIDNADTRVRMQALSYSVVEYSGDSFTDIDQALRRAAARGVTVELLLSDWNKQAPAIDALKELQRLDNITVKLVTIPEHKSGFIPFARVIHSKLMTVDGTRSWVGTSNFSGDYFNHSRNIGLFFEGASITRDLDRVFDTTWTSEYATVIDPDADYTAPRIAE